MNGNAGKAKPSSDQNVEHAAGDRLDVVLAAGDDHRDDLVVISRWLCDRELVLHAVEALGHLEVER